MPTIRQDELAQELRKLLLLELSKADQELGFLLSAGVDSTSLLIAALELKKSITVYSFTLENYISTDFSCAKRTAHYYGLNFVPIWLPTSHKQIISDIEFMIKNYNAPIMKTQIETGLPLLYANSVIGEKQVVMGYPAGDHYCSSKRASIHYKGSIELMDTFRREERERNYKNALPFMTRLLKDHELIIPWDAQAIFELHLGLSNDIVNRPIEKALIRFAFPEMKKLFWMYKKRAMNYQLGDSRIAKQIGNAALSSSYNEKGYKNPIGVYRTIARKVKE